MCGMPERQQVFYWPMPSVRFRIKHNVRVVVRIQTTTYDPSQKVCEMPPKQKRNASQTQAVFSSPSSNLFERISFEVLEGIVKEINIFELPNFLCLSKGIKV